MYFALSQMQTLGNYWTFGQGLHLLHTLVDDFKGICPSMYVYKEIPLVSFNSIISWKFRTRI